MRRYLVYLLCGTALLVFGCAEERVSAPPTPTDLNGLNARGDAETLAWALAEQAGWEIQAEAAPARPKVQCPGGHSPIVSFERTPITADIAHYAAQIRIGPGAHDVIGIHRVVRETRPYRPIRTGKAVFLQHGASTDFTFCYLPGQYSAQTPDDFGFAVYLAGNNIDVWGIDQRWCLVPPEETNFDFMATWDLPMHIADLGLDVDIARLVRCMTGNGWNQMLLLGFSFGAEISFGLVDGETQLPPGRRSVKGFIPVDMGIKLPEGSPWRELMCAFQPYYESQLAAGIYGEGVIFRPVGILARDDPEGDSPFFPGLTNYQAALAMGTTLLYGVSPFHLFAGIFEGGLPIGMQFISNEAWIELLCTMSYVESNVAALDQCQEICGGDVAWNRNWAQIEVPVFYVTPRGGFGEAGLYQLDLLGSHDVSSLVVSAVPGDPTLDCGHLDLFLTTTAQSLVWQPILEWIEAHEE
jgi:hypothetical protein